MSRLKLVLVVLVGCLMAASTTAMAQDQQPQRGQRGQGRGNFDPAQFRQQQMDRMKEQLGATDDEWKVLQPKVEKVLDAQCLARSGAGFGGGGGRGGRGGGGGGGAAAQAPDTEVGKAAAALREALTDKATPTEEITKKLTALRDARTKARDALTVAQKELKELLTQRQEAQLVVTGTLE